MSHNDTHPLLGYASETEFLAAVQRSKDELAEQDYQNWLAKQAKQAEEAEEAEEQGEEYEQYQDEEEYRYYHR